MRKRRVAIFTGNYNHIRDGVSNTLNRLVEYLESEGHSVIVIGPWSPDPVMSHKGTYIPVYAIPAPGRPEYRISMGFTAAEKEMVTEFSPDLIHIATPDILGFEALRYAVRNRIPVVASYHTHFSSYLKYYRLGILESLLQKYLRWFYKKCEHLYVPSPSMLEELKMMGVDSDLRLWTRGVDTGVYHPEKRDDAFRGKLGFQQTDIVVSFVSRLVWEKNLGVLADVFQRIGRENPSVRTLIVGDGPARKELSEMLPETVFTGHLEGEELAMSYAGSDLFFFPSDTESFGNVTLEAMSCGLPAVVAEASGSRSLVENNVNGFRAEADDVAEFTDRILYIVNDPEIRKEMAVKSREKAVNYDWGNVLATLVSYYNEVLRR